MRSRCFHMRMQPSQGKCMGYRNAYPTSLLDNAYVVHTLLPSLVMRTLPYLHSPLDGHATMQCKCSRNALRTLLPESISLCPANLPVLPLQHVEEMQKLPHYILEPVVFKLQLNDVLAPYWCSIPHTTQRHPSQSHGATVISDAVFGRY